MKARVHPLIQAGLAMGIAGAGRIALNSVIGLGFGHELLARYGVLLSSITLAGGVAAAGPYGAVTLGVARKWAEAPGELPAAYLRFLFVASAAFLGVLIAGGYVWSGGPGLLWVAAVSIYALYQILRAFGYAVQRADVVTVCEAFGAVLPLAAVPVLAHFELVHDPEALVLAYTAGIGTFILSLLFALRGRVALSAAGISTAERRLALRESSIFAVGAGSSTAMQFLPTVLAAGSPEVAVILFGALHATAPLLVLSRVYTTVMIPALASGDDSAGGVESHMSAMGRILVPSTAIALGAAPWIAISLGLEISLFTVATGALVGMVTLFQVWSTPAVTVLSAKHRELIPALSSAGGLAVAAAIWGATDDPAMLPVGLAAGGIVRSLVPAWIAGGRSFGRLDGPGAARAAAMLAMCGVVYLCGVTETPVSLAIGAALGAAGVAGIALAWRRRNA